MKNEKLRSKHQKALLELRQQAVKEKTDAKLQWIDIKKRFVFSGSTINTNFLSLCFEAVLYVHIRKQGHFDF